MAVRRRTSSFRQLANAIRLATRPGSASMGARAAAVPRLVQSTVSGQYKGTTGLRLLGMAAAVVYIISPIDLVPEGIFLMFGLVDDAVVLSWLAVNLVTETEDFLAWEQAGGANTGAHTHAHTSQPNAGPQPYGQHSQPPHAGYEPYGR